MARTIAAAAALACALPAQATARDVVVTSFDDTPIVAHFYPAAHLANGAKTPTVLVGHGWGGTGSVAADGGTGVGTGGSVAIGDLRRAGFNVLTWDARGFGGSGGFASIDAPDREARDVQALISFVAQQPEALLDAVGDPRIGMAGSSYGGGIQLVTSSLEPRIDTIVPDIAWNSLLSSLFKDDSVKFGWGLLLTGIGIPTSVAQGIFSPAGIQAGSLDPRILQAFTEGGASGRISPASREFFRSRGPGDAVARIKVPTLITQGTIDTLFTLREAITNYGILRRNGVPVKMIWHCGGHGVCDFPAEPRGTVERRVIAWFKRHLARETDVDTGPRFEWVDDNGRMHASDDYPLVPRSGPAVSRTDAGTIGLSPGALSGDPVQATPALGNAIDVPLPAPKGREQIVGEPVMTLTYKGTAAPRQAFVFAQIVDRARRQVLGNQVTPIPVFLDGKQRRVTRRLEGIAAAAGPGSRLVLQVTAASMVYGPQRALGSITLDAVTAKLPAGDPVVGGTVSRPRLGFGAIRRSRAGAVRAARGAKRFRLCARGGRVRSIVVVVKKGRRIVARSPRRFAALGCRTPRVRRWRNPARGIYTVVAAGRDSGGGRVRTTKRFRLR